MRGAVIRLERQLTELQLQQVAAQKAAASSPASTSAKSDGVQTPCSANVEVTPAYSGQSLDLGPCAQTRRCNLDASLPADRDCDCLSFACLICCSQALGLLPSPAVLLPSSSSPFTTLTSQVVLASSALSC